MMAIVARCLLQVWFEPVIDNSQVVMWWLILWGFYCFKLCVSRDFPE